MQLRTSRLLGFGLAMLTVAGMSGAQGVYKIVGPDGKVTFSDKPPAAGQATTANTGSSSANNAGGSDLPFELRQVTSKYPVTLYSSAQCAPCDTGRTLLKSRGVPFNEKTISTSEDNEALQRLAGEASLPFATIGGQKLKGFSEVEWTQYLDAAGYPKSPMLPKAYRYPAATPLVAVQKAAPVKPEAAAKPTAVEPAALPSPSAPSPSNPAGITF